MSTQYYNYLTLWKSLGIYWANTSKHMGRGGGGSWVRVEGFSTPILPSPMKTSLQDRCNALLCYLHVQTLLGNYGLSDMLHWDSPQLRIPPQLPPYLSWQKYNYQGTDDVLPLFCSGNMCEISPRLWSMFFRPVSRKVVFIVVWIDSFFLPLSPQLI